MGVQRVCMRVQRVWMVVQRVLNGIERIMTVVGVIRCGMQGVEMAINWFWRVGKRAGMKQTFELTHQFCLDKVGIMMGLYGQRTGLKKAA